MKIKRIFYHYWQSAKKHQYILYLMFLVYGLAAVSSNIINPIIFKNIVEVINTIAPKEATAEITRLVFLLALNTLFFNLFFRFGDFAIAYFEAKSMRDISKRTFQILSKHSYNFYANSFAGALVAKTKRFTSSFEGIVDRLSLDIYFIFIKITGVLIVLFIEARILAIYFLIWLLMYIMVVLFLVRYKRKYDLISAEADSKTTASLADIISNVLNVKIFASKGKEISRHNRVLDKEYQAIIKVWTVGNLQLACQGLLIAILQVGTLYVSINLWLRGSISGSMVVLVQTYMIILSDALWGIGRSMVRITKDLSNAQEMVEILDKPIEITDPENPENCRIKDGEIIFNNVSFKYANGKNVLENFNLKIKPGEKVGLVGHSGAGKTTITKVLLHFADIDSGEVLIDGQNIIKITQDDLRSKISYVPQEPILFHRSIKENIGYSNMSATETEILKAAEKAHAHKFISKLPNGYDTLVGERGIKLSGGERQRIAIARAMLKDAPIIVLDEATSSLDSESESYIQDAFEKLMKGKTTVVIAHRLSTVKKLDRIIVLDDGKIAEEGTHEQLLSKGGQYAKLWDHQTGNFLND